MSSSLEMISAEPEKMSITNVDDPSLSISPEYNPTELMEQVQANWTKLAIPGLSHQRLQYTGTSNETLTFTLHYDTTNRTVADHDRFSAQRKFLLAHLYPRRGAGTIRSGAPPRLLFVWPMLASMIAVLTDIKIRHMRFNSNGAPVVWEIELTLEEIRDVRLTFEDVIASGTFRSGGA